MYQYVIHFLVFIGTNLSIVLLKHSLTETCSRIDIISVLLNHSLFFTETCSSIDIISPLMCSIIGMYTIPISTFTCCWRYPVNYSYTNSMVLSPVLCKVYCTSLSDVLNLKQPFCFNYFCVVWSRSKVISSCTYVFGPSILFLLHYKSCIRCEAIKVNAMSVSTKKSDN